MRKLDVEDMEAMGLPQSHWKTSLKRVPQSIETPLKRYLDSITKYIPDGVGMLITGAKGVGKTSVASLVARQTRSHRMTVLYLSAWDFRDKRRTQRFEDKGRQPILRRVTEVDLLILDDLAFDDIQDRYYGEHEIKSLLRARSNTRKASVVIACVPSNEDMDLMDAKEQERAEVFRDFVNSLPGEVEGLIRFHIEEETNRRRERNEELTRGLFAKEGD